MNQVSFMLANYVARPLGYNMTEGWGQGSKATIAYFKPVETFRERLNEYLTDVKALGFDAVDMWTDILGPDFATQEHIDAALELLREHGLQLCSYGGWFGATPDEFTATCELVAAFGSPILGGSTSMLVKDRAFVVDTLKKYGLRLGIENHPETPDEILEKIGDGANGTIGTTVDTGWYGTQGFDAAEAIERLGPHVMVVHLKDVREAGEHNTCRFSEGIVPIERCVQVLKKMGYTGSLSVEHEPELFDPTEDIAVSLGMLQGWLRE